MFKIEEKEKLLLYLPRNLKPGFYVIVRIAPIAPVLSNNVLRLILSNELIKVK